MTGTDRLLDAIQTVLNPERFFEEVSLSEEARSFLTGS